MKIIVRWFIATVTLATDLAPILYFVLITIYPFLERLFFWRHDLWKPFIFPVAYSLDSYNWIYFWTVTWSTILSLSFVGFLYWEPSWGGPKFAYHVLLGRMFFKTEESISREPKGKFWLVLWFFSIAYSYWFVYIDANLFDFGQYSQNRFGISLNPFKWPNWVYDYVAITQWAANVRFFVRPLILGCVHFYVTSNFDMSCIFILIIPLLVGFVFVLLSPLYILAALVGTFFHIALILLWTKIEFFSAIILIVYTGAISVLFLFVIILLNIRDQEKFDTRSTSILFISLIILVLGLGPVESQQSIYYDMAIGNVFSDLFTESIKLPSFFNSFLFSDWHDATILNHYLYGHYSFLFMVGSWLLLVTMVGSIALLSSQLDSSNKLLTPGFLAMLNACDFSKSKVCQTEIYRQFIAFITIEVCVIIALTLITFLYFIDVIQTRLVVLLSYISGGIYLVFVELEILKLIDFKYDEIPCRFGLVWVYFMYCMILFIIMMCADMGFDIAVNFFKKRKDNNDNSFRVSAFAMISCGIQATMAYGVVYLSTFYSLTLPLIVFYATAGQLIMYTIVRETLKKYGLECNIRLSVRWTAICIALSIGCPVYILVLVKFLILSWFFSGPLLCEIKIVPVPTTLTGFQRYLYITRKWLREASPRLRTYILKKIYLYDLVKKFREWIKKNEC